MNEQLLAYWNKIRKHLTAIMIALFVILTSIVGWFYLSERIASGPQGDQAEPQRWSPEKKIEGDPRMEDFLTTFTASPEMFSESREIVLMVQNPWEIRTAKDQEKIEQEALRLHQEAKAAFEKGDFRRAEILATQAKANKPTFAENDELLVKIRAQTTP